MAEGRDPFVRVQYNYSTEIYQLDITAVLGMMIKRNDFKMAFKPLVTKRFITFNLHLLVENGIHYTVFVKQLPYTRDELDICSKFTYNSRSIKKTVTFTCNRLLQGKYIEIVASSSAKTTLKVFEIERFGRFKTFKIAII